MDRYRGIERKKSPRRQAINKQLDEHTLRIKQLMQQDYIILEQQNTQLKKKCVKYNQLQQKVELVLKHNENLCIQNQKLAKLMEDKINQCELLKKKIQSSKKSNQGMNQYERKKLFNEIQRLQKQIQQRDHFKNIAIKQIRTKHQIQIENLIRDHQVGIRYYDDQLIKLKQLLDRKDIQLNIFQSKCKKSEADNQFQLSQLRQEKMRMLDQLKRFQSMARNYQNLKQDHNKLLQESKRHEEDYLKINELTRQNERLQINKKKQDDNNTLALKQLSQKYQNLLQNKKKEDQVNFNKIRELTQKLNGQIQLFKNTRDRSEALEQQNNNLQIRLKKSQKKVQQLQQKLRGLKQQSESNQQRMRRQIQLLKNQIKQLNIINDKQIQALQQKFDSLRQQQIGELCKKHQNYRLYMQNEVNKLNQLLLIKDGDLNFLSEQKALMNKMFIEQGNQMKNQLIMLQKQFKQNQMLHENELRRMQEEFRLKNKRTQQELLTKIKKCESGASQHIQKLQSEYFNLERQKKKLTEDLHKKSTENIAYKQIIQNQKQQIKQNTKKAEQRQKLIKKSEQQWKKSFMDMKSKLQMQEANWDKQKNQVIRLHEQKQDQLINQIKQRQKIISQLQKQNQSIKQFVSNRDKSILEVNKRINELNKIIDERNQIINELRNKLVTQTQNSAQKNLNDKKKMEQHYQDRIKYLTQDFSTKIFILQKNNQDLTILLRQKQSQIQQLIKQYKLMRDEMQVLTQQDANKRDISLKFPGATANLIATKNMFDVFVKSKVMTVCSEVIKDTVFKEENDENMRI